MLRAPSSANFKPSLLAQHLGLPVVPQLLSGVTKVLKTLQVEFGKIRFNYQFLLSDVANPIQGMDFFTKFNLLISPPPTRSCLPQPWTPSSSQVPHRAPLSRIFYNSGKSSTGVPPLSLPASCPAGGHDTLSLTGRPVVERVPGPLVLR